jgi:hypothetical protein
MSLRVRSAFFVALLACCLGPCFAQSSGGQGNGSSANIPRCNLLSFPEYLATGSAIGIQRQEQTRDLGLGV